VTLTRGREKHPVLSQRDTGKSTLEDRLPALIRVLKIGEADWARNADLAQSTEVSPPGKARCLLQPVLLYWLHERDA